MVGVPRGGGHVAMDAVVNQPKIDVDGLTRSVCTYFPAHELAVS